MANYSTKEGDMPHGETYEFTQKPFLLSVHVWERSPEIYLEYGPFLHHEYGVVIDAAEFVKALSTLPPDHPLVMPLRVFRDCCGSRSWVHVIENAIQWTPNEETVLQVGRNRLTAPELLRFVAWLASVPFMDPCHTPHIELDEETQVGFNRLCRRLGIQSPLHAV